MKANSSRMVERLFLGRLYRPQGNHPSTVPAPGPHSIYQEQQGKKTGGNESFSHLPDISKSRWYICRDGATKQLCTCE